MYRKILVPLDGSELAECVLPHVETIIAGCGVEEIIFIRVVEPVSIPSGTWTDGGSVITETDTESTRQRLNAGNETAAKEYLDKIVDKFGPRVKNVQGVMLKGKAADELVEYIQENEADLVIIASHGRSGISRWIYGSVAEKLLRSACTPVLMIRAPGCAPGF
jgi:nucleotide-binding universal stress UspA family protein